jgi:hypothetical protein
MAEAIGVGGTELVSLAGADRGLESWIREQAQAIEQEREELEGPA